jgi:hypothetical protein
MPLNLPNDKSALHRIALNRGIDTSKAPEYERLRLYYAAIKDIHATLNTTVTTDYTINPIRSFASDFREINHGLFEINETEEDDNIDKIRECLNKAYLQIMIPVSMFDRIKNNKSLSLIKAYNEAFIECIKCLEQSLEYFDSFFASKDP